MARLGLMMLVLAALAIVPVTGASTTSGVRGKVTKSSPVCIEDQPCSKPAPGVLIVFRHDGRIAAQMTTRADATYRVTLAPGTYKVAAPQYRHG